MNRRQAMVLTGATLLSANPAAAQSESDLQATLVDRIDVRKASVGIAVARVAATGSEFAGHGSTGGPAPRPINQDTVFEIGSISKLFTALLLADAAKRGEVSLEDPANDLLPADLRLPQRGSRDVTLLDLATHNSGLPKNPPNLPPLGDAAAAAHYSAADLGKGLRTLRPARDPGSAYEYSNLGFGLLGLALGHRLGGGYEASLARRIAAPLGLTATGIRPSARLAHAVGHDGDLTPSAAYFCPALVAAGGLRSTARDLSRFLRAALALEPTPLAPAFDLMLSARRPGPSPSTEQGLGWQIIRQGGATTILKTGDTYGFTAVMAMNREARQGVALLSNSTITQQDIALHTLYPAFPLSPAHTEIALDAAVLDRYVGRYDAGGGRITVVSRGTRGLMLRLPDAPALRLHPETQTRFIAREVDLAFTFVVAGDGRVSGLAQGGGPPAPRLAP